MSRGIGVAVIGAGMAGRAHAHGYRSAGTVFSAGLPPVRLVSVADINEELAADTARRYGFERSDTSWQAIVKADDIDVVSVVVANHLHREVVERAGRGGQARAVREAAGPDVGRRPGDDRRRGRRRGRRPGSGSPSAGRRASPRPGRRSSPGELGRPLYINAQYWTDYGSDPQAPMSWRYRGGPGSGALADLGSHLADTAEFLLGPVESVTGAALTTVIAERPAAAGPRRRARPGRGQRPARAGGERRLGQLLGPLRRRCHRRPERVPDRRTATRTPSSSRCSASAARWPST